MASTDEHWDPVFEVPAGFVDGLFRLDGRVAVVTGGGSGLGAAMAKGLAQSGAALAIVDIGDEGMQRTVGTIAPWRMLEGSATPKELSSTRS